MVSRNTIRNDILKTYDLERAKAYQLTGKVKGRIAITTTMWTSKNSTRGYMAITAHFIDDSWILQSCILRFVYGPALHTADVLEYKSKALVMDKSSSSIVSETINHGSSSSSSHAFGATIEMDPLSKLDLFVASNVSSMSVRSELDIYLEECILPRTPSFDVLSWWKTNGVKYPNLQKMAKDILAIPVSTVASESAFSTSGRLIGPHRSRLRPETLEAFMCTRSWLSKEFNNALATILDEEEDTTSVIELTEL